jgi:hypothetical protein
MFGADWLLTPAPFVVGTAFGLAVAGCCKRGLKRCGRALGHLLQFAVGVAPQTVFNILPQLKAGGVEPGTYKFRAAESVENHPPKDPPDGGYPKIPAGKLRAIEVAGRRLILRSDLEAAFLRSCREGNGD